MFCKLHITTHTLYVHVCSTAGAAAQEMRTAAAESTTQQRAATAALEEHVQQLEAGAVRLKEAVALAEEKALAADERVEHQRQEMRASTELVFAMRGVLVRPLPGGRNMKTWEI